MTEDKKKFSITVNSNTKDLYNFMSLVPNRKKRIENASNEPKKSDPINTLAKALHPERQYLIISEIRDETKSAKTFKLVPDPDSITSCLAYFRAGQYLSLKVTLNGVEITRPYSISSSPLDALEGFYEITIRKEEQGFLTSHIWNNWKVGTKVVSSGPEGFFYFEPLRDLKNVIGIAGGSGITPFRSIAKSIIKGKIDANLTIFYGSSEEDDIIYYEEFNKLMEEYSNKLKIIYILSCEVVSLKGCESGFITGEIIEKYCDVKNSTVFICGPQVMYEFVERELNRFDIPKKRIRREAFGEIKDIINYSGYPKELAEKTFRIKVQIGDKIQEIPANATESILVAMERANLAPPSKCRSGECGFCRSLLISGNIYISPISDWRKAADKKYNYFHPCYSYPISNLEINVPRHL